MTAHLTAKRRIERALPAAMFGQITTKLVSDWVADLGEEEAVKQPIVIRVAAIDKLFVEAFEEAFADLGEMERTKAKAQCRRLHTEAMAPLAPRPIATAYRMLVAWIQYLHDEAGILEIGGASPFYRAFCELLDAMAESDGAMKVLDDVERSAVKKAMPQFQQWFEMRGYFVVRRAAA